MRRVGLFICVALVLPGCGEPEAEPTPQRRQARQPDGGVVAKTQGDGPEAEAEAEAESEPERLAPGEAAPPETTDPDVVGANVPREAGVKEAPPEIDPDALMPTEAVDPHEGDLDQAEEFAEASRSLDDERLEIARKNRNSYEQRELPPDAPPPPPPPPQP